MGMHVFSYLKQTLKRKDKSRDADWDFGAHQSSPVDATASTRRDSRAATSTSASASGSRRRRSASLDDPRQPYSPLAYQQQQEQEQQQQQQHCQQRRVSAALVSGSGSDVNGPHGHDRGHAQCQPDSRVSAGGPRSGSPEDDVLLAAGETAKGVRTAVNPSEKRRRDRSMAPVASPSGRPTLRHATSALTTRDGVPIPSSPTSSRSNAGSPTPSVQSFHSRQAGPSDASRRAALLASKRSMPQLHNVWENFLEEVAEDVDSFSFPMPPHSQSPGKYASVHATPKTNSTGNQHSRHLHHTPTSSSSSTSTATTTVSVGTIRTLPRNPAPDSLPQSPSPNRSRGHMRASHQTSSSTSSATTSTQGSTSSMAAFSSASSMTTAPDDCDDGSHLCDDPVSPTPRSNVPMSPKGFKFTADPSLSSPITQRLRKSPTSPALQHQRGVSPTSSTSSESYVSSPASCSHSQSTTPTPSSACPTPSPTPCSAASPTSPVKYVGRLGPVDSRASGQYRQTPEIELPEQPLSSGLTKGHKPLSNSYRYSAAAGRSQVELRLFPAHEEDVEEVTDEDVLSELGYRKASSLRGKTQQQQRQSIQTATFSPPSRASSSPTPSGSPVIPPLRCSSRQHLRTVVTHSVDSLSLPRAKSASNIRYEALQCPPLTGSDSSPPLPAAKENGTAAAASSGAPVYLHEARLPSRPLNHARSQTLQHGQQVAIDANSMAASPTSSRPGQGRLRSGSSSLVYNHTLPQAKAPPCRPPPAPPLDMHPTRLHPPAAGRGSASASPLTPASAVHWGYAL
ncbi:hypothetical protein ACEPAF_6679 [Sanghuangporus sanghuang]